MYHRLQYKIMRMLFVITVILLSCPIKAQIQVSGNIQVSEITQSEFERAYTIRQKQPRFHRKGKRVSKLKEAYIRDIQDSLMYYDSLNDDILGYVRIRLQAEKREMYLITVFFPTQNPTQSLSYLYNHKYERVSNDIWGGGILDGCLYAVDKDFDCDEYVHLRFYDLSHPMNHYAEIKEESFEYFIPCDDNRESYFFDKSHIFYFTIMKKNGGPCKYYKVNTQELRKSSELTKR